MVRRVFPSRTVFPLFIFLLLILGGIFAVRADAKTISRPHRVIMVVIDKVMWSDLEAAQPPNLLKLAHRGSVGLMSNHTGETEQTTAGAYLTIGTGLRSVGKSSGGPLTPKAMSELKRINKSGNYGAHVGLLADRLHSAGLSTVVLGNADARGPNDGIIPGREIELIGADGHGRITGDTSRALLGSESNTDYQALLRAFDRASNRSGLFLIETGDTRRAARAGLGLTQQEQRSLNGRAILAADRFVGNLTKRLDYKRDLLLIVSPTSAFKGDLTLDAALTPIIVVGNDYRPGWLASASTRRTGLVTSIDLAPTIADQLGATWGIDTPGRVMQSVPAKVSFAGLAAQSEGYLMTERLATPIIWIYCVIMTAALLSGAALLSLTRIPGRRVNQGFRLWLLFSFALPLSIFIAPLLPMSLKNQWLYLAYIVAVAFLLTWLAWRLRYDWALPIMVLSMLTTAFLVVNLLLGAPGDLNSALGYTAVTAGRFYGIGNHSLAILIGAALLSSFIWVSRHRLSSTGFLIMFYVFLVVLIGNGSLGANTGGIMMSAPTLTLAYCWVKYGKLRPVHLLLATVSGGAGLVLMAVMDTRLPQPAHLGAAVRQVYLGNLNAFHVVLMRKVRSNLSILNHVLIFFSPLIIMGGLAMAWLFRRRRWDWLVLRYPAVGMSLIIGLIGGLIGSLANDSGVAVLALIAGYLLTAVVYLEFALRDEKGLNAEVF